MKELVVRGARQHNLRDVDVTLPRDKLIVITGPSGSGKSSLAFDTIYAEGQRRYVESLSAYARQFLDQMPKPDVDVIEGLSPAISIEQKTTSRNPRSTVGTVTEIYDYLRLLFARAGTPCCPICGEAIAAQTVQQIVDRVLAMPEGTRLQVLAPVVRGRKGAFAKELAEWRRDGYVRATIDGAVRDLGDEITLDKARAHTIDLHVDRLAVRADIRPRLTDSVELALRLADGLVAIDVPPSAPGEQGQRHLFSERFACVAHGVSLPEISPRTFSFNNPAGACPACNGLGEVRWFDPDLVVPDPDLSLAQGAIAAWGKEGGVWQRHLLEALARKVKVKLDVPWKKLPPKLRETILHGDGQEGGWEGVLPGLERRSKDYERRKREEGQADDDTFEFLEDEFMRFSRSETCKACGGARLRPEALAVKVAGRNIRDVTALTIREAREFFGSLALDAQKAEVARRILKEIGARLGFLSNVGLDYLSLDRAAATLSGGEAERIRLATQIGAALTGVLYVLDEPSIGLHPRDNERLIPTLAALRDLGNTVLVVEHDAETILAADHVVDMGPGAGKHGGRVVAQGTPAELMADPASLTGQYLAGARGMALPARRRRGAGELVVRGARAHNLRDVTARFPLGTLTCVTGVSGSGKSSLVMDTLLAAARSRVHGARAEPVSGEVLGLERIDKVIHIDQSPIGRSPRSNPATYTGLFTHVRELYASLPEARARGYKPGRFSFNVKGGRCEACQGDGVLRIEMHFLPDVFVTCEECGGKRYNRETLEIRYRGKHIAELLATPIEEAAELLGSVPRIAAPLRALVQVGLGYVELGQSATTLSGGEAQRVKLARELARKATGQTLYILDEPTTGLHFGDVEVLVGVLQELVAQGNTVLVIEHNLDVIAMADHVIDMGPEGGSGGGRVVATGTPEELAQVPESHTGRFLAQELARRRGFVPRGGGPGSRGPGAPGGGATGPGEAAGRIRARAARA
jgi:excinuclease ABC subunit A